MDEVQFTLVAGLILMALVNAISLLWASYMDRKARGRQVPKIYEVHLEGTKVFSEADLSQIEKNATAYLQKAVDEAGERLQSTLKTTVDKIAGNIEETTAAQLAQELEKYQISLEALREQTIHQFSNIQTELDTRREQMLEQLNHNFEKERAARMEQFNARLNDVVASYLAESLGNQVDLGAQTSYILQTLEAHKEDIKRDVLE